LALESLGYRTKILNDGSLRIIWGKDEAS
jgi:hypothetical protein